MQKNLCSFLYSHRHAVTKTCPARLRGALLMMKFTAIFLLAFCLQVSARVNAQKVTLSEKGSSLQKIFRAIKKQTGLSFFFDESWLSQADKVTINVQDVPVEKALDICFLHQPLTYSLVGTTVVIKQREIAAPKTTPTDSIETVKQITGRVTDENGTPLSGVSVVVRATRVGTSTNADGTFTVEANKGDVLEFTIVGYKRTSVAVGNDLSLSIKLAIEVAEGNEVVVTAIGITRNKKSLAYSTQSVEGAKLAEVRETNVVNSLKGRVAGVHINPSSGGPAGSSFVVIRGNSSLTGNNQPLYVVDGVPIDNQTLGQPGIFGSQRDYGDGIGNINPDDIENVTVLKGPAAAALYGARGAHGVILITSKKGKAGRLNVDFNSNATFEKLNTTPTFQSTYGGGYDDNYTSFDNVVINGQTVSQWPAWLQDNWGGKYDGRMISIATWPELGLVPYTAKGDDNFKKFYRTGSTFTNTVGVSGGSERATFRLSLSDMRNQGIVPNNQFNRQTINLLTNFKISSKLTVEAKVNYVRQHQTNPPETGGSGTSATVALNRMPLFLDMNWLKNYKRDDGTMINYKSGTPRNPYWILNELLADGRRDRVIGYVLAKYQFTNWLSLQARTGTDFYNDTRFSRVGINTPSITDGSVNNDEYNVKEDNSDVLLTASGNLSKNFTASFSAGANHLNRRTGHLSVVGSGFNIPNLYNVGNAKLVTSSDYPTQRQMNSVYFDGQVGYKNYLFLSVTGRNDWSSTLGMNNYSFFYPSVSSSFVFTDALQMHSTILSYGKIRASYAEAGNDASPYLTKGGYDLSSSNYNGQPFAYVSGAIPLIDLKNELTRSYEFGTELKFFNNRLGLDFTYYNASTINQITPVQISATTGFATRLINAGEIKNHGVEIFASGTPIASKNFRWDVTLNFSKNKSRVVSLAPGLATLTLLDTYNGGTIEARPGQSYGNIVGLPFMRNDAGDIVLTEAGAWQPGNQQVILGNIQPDWLGGITNIFSYKGVQLSVLIDIRQGGQVYSMSKYNQMAGGTGKFTENRDHLIANGVILQTDGKYVKSDKVLLAQDYYALQGPWSGIGETMVINADYVAFREASISYNLGSASLLKKSVLKSAKISIVGRNLFYIYRDPQFKTMGVSPETAFNTTAAAQGVETPGIPTTRSLGFNLSFSF
ncbi:MAG: SusC/RagA family TonB-linked outer membrane protein [Agriterribacter sp.]